MDVEESVLVASLFPKVNLHKQNNMTFTVNVNKQRSAASPFLFPRCELMFAASSPVIEAP